MTPLTIVIIAAIVMFGIGVVGVVAWLFYTSWLNARSRRLAGDAIPLGGRVIGAVEIYDALTTSRPYQEKMPPEVAVERMRDLIGTVIDPAVHSALEAVVSQRQALVFLDDHHD